MIRTSTIILSVLAACSAQAASFECSKAESADEKAICSNPALNEADVRMTTMFEMEVDLVAMGERDTLRGTQKKWLARRSDCKADIACLTGAYADRITDLKQVFKDIVSRGPGKGAP